MIAILKDCCARCTVVIKGCATILMLLSLMTLNSYGQTRAPHQPDTFLKNNHRALAKNPAGINFKLQLKNGKTKYQLGEIIEVELIFTADKPDTYKFSSGGLELRDRFTAAKFILDAQDGVVDPLHDYYNSHLFFSLGGLIGGPSPIDQPIAIKAELNEWIRFDRPGKYRLYASSNRIISNGPKGQSAQQSNSVVSNIVEFEILPANPAWAVQTLREAVRALESKSDHDDKTITLDRRHATHVLRFLNTEAAARELVRYYTEQDKVNDKEILLGLWGHPEKTFIVNEMERMLSAPEFPVTESFIQTLTILSWSLQLREPIDEVDRERARKQLKEQWELQQAITDQYLDQLIAAFDDKQQQARAICLNTLFEYANDKNLQKRSPALAAKLELLSKDIITSFLMLPVEKQKHLLEFNWQQISSPAMLPILRELYEHPPKTENYFISMRALALGHIYELDPIEGRRLIIAEITLIKPRVDINLLSKLLDKELPELDDILIEKLEKFPDPDRDYVDEVEFERNCRLLARYASISALPHIKNLFGDHGYNLEYCARQAPILAYYLRVDPEFGAQAFRQALTNRKNSSCYRTLFSAVTEIYPNADLSEIARTALNEEDSDLVADATKYLSKHEASAVKRRPKQRMKE